MTEFEKVALIERLAEETGLELFAQVIRRDWKEHPGHPTCGGYPLPCGIATTCCDGRVVVFLSESSEIDGECISAEDFEINFEVIHMSFI